MKATEWDEFNWSSEATHRFVESESRGIPGTVAYAVVAGSMALRDFPVPKDLNKRLYCANQHVQEQRKELAEAEERRQDIHRPRPESEEQAT